FELGSLYATSTAYAVGVGVWLDAELRLRDPATRLIPPTLLGVAAPLGVYIADHPALPRGLPAAISTGLFVGAGEGLGIASLQMATAERAWGPVGLGRALVIGGGAG